MKKFALYILIIGLTPTVALAGGLNRINNAIGPRAGGMCGAYNAIADDASLFYYNPAGMSRFDSVYAELGTDVVLPKLKIKVNGYSQNSNNGAFNVLPFGGYIRPISDRINIGIGITVPYGLGAKFESDFKTGVVKSETLLALTNITPAISFQLSDTLSLGLGLNVGYGQFKYLAPFDFDGKYIPLETDSEGEGWGLGGVIGLMWQPKENLTLGLTYMSETKVKLRGQTKIGPEWLDFQDGFDSAFTFPSRVGAGIAFQATNKLLIAFDVNWWGYSKAVSSMTLAFHDLPMEKTNLLGWHDNYSFDLGCRYQLNDNWEVSGGLGYMSEAVPAKTLGQLTPDSSGYGLALGLGYKRENLALNASANYGWGEKKVRNEFGNRAPGDYKAEILTFGLSGSYKF